VLVQELEWELGQELERELGQELGLVQVQVQELVQAQEPVLGSGRVLHSQKSLVQLLMLQPG
jgi:hypothetical protein